jgi:hypothetical protein
MSDLNAGAELEKELAEKLGWRLSGKIVEQRVNGKWGWIHPRQAGTAFAATWTALLEYAAEAAMYRNQWKEAEKLLRVVEQEVSGAVYMTCRRCGLNVSRDDWNSLIRYRPDASIRCHGCHGEIGDWQRSAESRVAALQAQLETTLHALEELFALVRGEVPRILEGDFRYDLVSEAIISGRAALSQLPTPAQEPTR